MVKMACSRIKIDLNWKQIVSILTNHQRREELRNRLLNRKLRRDGALRRKTNAFGQNCIGSVGSSA